MAKCSTSLDLHAVQDSSAQKMNPVLLTIMAGIYDPYCVLHALIGVPHVTKLIWRCIQNEWRRCIKTFPHEPLDIPWDIRRYRAHTEEGGLSPGNHVECAVLCYQNVLFPPPKKININMMPFKMVYNFNKTKLPKKVEPYFGMIQMCMNLTDSDEHEKIGFLTIHESYVEPGVSQRRPGVHVEKGRKVYRDKNGICVSASVGGADADVFAPPIYSIWGRGEKKSKGGIFMATNLDDSCRIWNCKVLDHPVDNDEVIGHLGDISHLEHLLPEGQNVRGNMLYWITDRTPHQSQPIENGGHRQFFRLVTSEVTLWYEDHSTLNPNGLKLDPNMTKIVKGSKFGETRIEEAPKSHKFSSWVHRKKHK